jgi:hypothetical protein
MSVRVALAVLLAFVALAAVGCGGYGNGGGGGGSNPGGGTTTTSGGNGY